MVSLSIDRDEIDNIKLAIFDKDGTLMELYHYWSQMIAMRAELICRKIGLGREHEDNLIYVMGVDMQAGMLRSEGPVGLKKREIVLQAAVDYLKTIWSVDAYELCSGVFNVVDELSSHRLGSLVRPIEGASNLINELFDNECKIAIATTDRHERAQLAMQFLGFGDKIAIVVGADNVRNPKPAPEMVDLILSTLKIDRTNTVVVGDAISDVHMGLNAGVRASIGVLTGFATIDELKKITPFVAKSVRDIMCKKMI